jgi:hypothetical protein
MTHSDIDFVPPTRSRLRVMRKGHNIIRKERMPKPFVLVDTREKAPLPLHANHPNWIGGERRESLKTGDYTVEGMEDLLCLERKNLADVAACTVTYRRRFILLHPAPGLPDSRGRPSSSRQALRTLKAGSISSTSLLTFIRTPFAGRLMRSRRSLGFRSSTAPPSGIFPRNVPPVGCRSISRIGGWKNRDSVEC